MPNFIEIGVGSRKFSKKLVDLTRNDPSVFRRRPKTPSSTSTLYSAPSYSRIMRRHCVCGGLLVGKRVQEVWEKKRKKGKIVINKKFTGKINMKKKEENKPNMKNKKTSYCGG